MQQTLRNLIADGKTKQAIAELRRLTASDSDTNNAVNLLASRFAEYQKQKLGNLEDPSVLDIKLNQINNALLVIIDRLDDTTSDGSVSNAPVTKKPAFSWTKWTGLNDVKSWIAAIAGILAILKFCGHEPTDKGKLINVSVGVEDQNHHLIPAFQKGENAFVLMMVEGGDTKEEMIDYKGTASFKNVKVGDSVRFKVKFSDPYHPLKDSVYTIPSDGRISLTVDLLNLEHVYGTVINEKGAFLEGVLIDVNGLRDTTDFTGSYEIFIPKNKQRPDQIVKFKKQGFKDKTKVAYPQNNEPLDVVMEK